MTSSLVPATVSWTGMTTYYGQNNAPPINIQPAYDHYKVIASAGVLTQSDFKSPTSYSFSIDESGPFNGRLTRYEKTPWNFLQSTWIGDLPVDTSSCGLLDSPSFVVDSRVYNRCLSKVIDEMKNSDINLGASIGEGRETLSMLKQLHKTAFETAVALRRSLKKRDWRLAVRTVGGIELLNNLGIQPLVADVNALKNHVLSGKMEEVRFQFKGRASDSEAFKRSRPDRSAIFGNVPPNFAFAEETEIFYRCALGGEYVITDLHSYENWRAGLGFTASTAWELITLSWLVDYFVKVGEFLEITEAALLYNGFVLRNAYKTVGHYTFGKQTVTGRITVVVDGSYCAVTECQRVLSHKDKQRSIIDSFPSPTLPTFKVPKSSVQLLNCAGLLSQLLK